MDRFWVSGALALSLLITAGNFLALVTVEALILSPQGWLLIGVVRHVLGWGILLQMLLLQFMFTSIFLLARGLLKQGKKEVRTA
jgi:hypothetical protein